MPNRGLRRGVYFYVNDFRSIDRAIVELETRKPEGTPVFQLKRLFAESLWTVVFWWIALVTLAYLGVGFTQYPDQLVYPITWVFQEASATLSWFHYKLDALFGVLQP